MFGIQYNVCMRWTSLNHLWTLQPFYTVANIRIAVRANQTVLHQTEIRKFDWDQHQQCAATSNIPILPF